MPTRVVVLVYPENPIMVCLAIFSGLSQTNRQMDGPTSHDYTTLCRATQGDDKQQWSNIRAFRFAKNNFSSIQFDSRQKIDSNWFVRFDSPTHARSCVVIVTVVSAAVIRRSIVWQTDANNQYNQIGRSNFFGETESTWINLLSKSIQIDLNRNALSNMIMDNNIAGMQLTRSNFDSLWSQTSPDVLQQFLLGDFIDFTFIQDLWIPSTNKHQNYWLTFSQNCSTNPAHLTVTHNNQKAARATSSSTICNQNR